MPSVVFFDCESDGKPPPLLDGQPDGYKDFSNVHATVVCAIVLTVEQIFHATQHPDDLEQVLAAAQYYTWWADDPDSAIRHFEPLLLLFDDAEAIAAFNGIEFDFPLLQTHYVSLGNKSDANRRYTAHRAKTFDPFLRIREATTEWYKLDALLKHNNLPTKSDTGAHAVHMWNAVLQHNLSAQKARARLDAADASTNFLHVAMLRDEVTAHEAREAKERDALATYCMDDVKVMTRMFLTHSIVAPKGHRLLEDMLLPHHLYHVASFLTGRRALSVS